MTMRLESGLLPLYCTNCGDLESNRGERALI